jgi:two-component sensor histidine kinase
MAASMPSQDTARGLTLAVVASSTAPMLLLDGDLMVVAASASFCRAFQLDPALAAGQPIFGLGDGEWDMPQLRSLLEATASGGAEVEAYEMDLGSERLGARRLVLSAHKLAYGDAEQVRLLLGVSDVTEARAGEKLKDDMLREKVILLQEVQHRVANSLQIIASVLMQSARRVQSEETRLHLHDAHQRVLSIADVQRQLGASGAGDVALPPYLAQLCRSLGASMIHDHAQLSLTVSADDGLVRPDVSVSLGLIGRAGRIVVGYRSRGPGWTLSVSDNGVGMPKDPASMRPGLGTSIIEALAKQLEAEVKVSDAGPGTVVSIIHTPAAVFDTRAGALSASATRLTNHRTAAEAGRP